MVIGIIGKKVKTENFSFLVTNKMQLEAMKPTHCAFFPLCKSLKSAMIKNPFVMANTDFGAVHKTDGGALSETYKIQKKHHRNKHLVLNGYKELYNNCLGNSDRRCMPT